MGDVCEEWMLCDLAAQSLGAIIYGIYPTCSVTEVDYQMRDGGAVMFIAEDQEYVDKVLAVADSLPALRWIVVIDDSAMFGYDHPKLKSYRELVETAAAPDLAAFEAQVNKLEPATRRPLSSTRPARPAIRRARSSATAPISPAPPISSCTIRRSPRRSTAPWSICRSATCSGATLR